MKHTWARAISMFRKRKLDREFDEELRSHIELATEDYIRRGMPPADARRLARVKFGSIEASKDAHRDSRGIAWLEALFYDLQFAMRALIRERAFAATAILMLALSLSLNVTACRVLDTMVFRSYPLVKENHRLLYLTEQYPTPGCCVSYIDFEQWGKQTHSFQGMVFLSGKWPSWPGSPSSSMRAIQTARHSGSTRSRRTPLACWACVRPWGATFSRQTKSRERSRPSSLASGIGRLNWVAAAMSLGGTSASMEPLFRSSA